MQVLYKYMRMELEQFAIFKENLANLQSEIEIKNEVQFNYSKDYRIMSCRNSVTYQQDGKPIMKADMRSDFAIEEQSAASLVQEDGKTIFEPGILIQFASLNYGSLRGVLHQKTLNTPVNDVILPPCLFQEIIKTPFVVE